MEAEDLEGKFAIAREVSWSTSNLSVEADGEMGRWGDGEMGR